MLAFFKWIDTTSSIAYIAILLGMAGTGLVIDIVTKWALARMGRQ
jgi:hypothetical protein